VIAPITAEQFNVNAADRAWVNAKMTPQAAGRVGGAVDEIHLITHLE
jgi:hypothetical protein